LQLPKAVLALFEKEFMGHTEQFAEPIVVLKKPAKHALQGPPSAPLCPLLHWQLLAAALPATEVESAGHSTHDALKIAATAVPYVFASQSVQDWDPTAGL
jgi:hypothetical protein